MIKFIMPLRMVCNHCGLLHVTFTERYILLLYSIALYIIHIIIYNGLIVVGGYNNYYYY